MTRYTEALLKC